MESKTKVHELEMRQDGGGIAPPRGHPLHTQVEAAHLFRRTSFTFTIKPRCYKPSFVFTQLTPSFMTETSNGEYAGRVLIPQPTSDPRDPLVCIICSNVACFSIHGLIEFYRLGLHGGSI